MRIFFLKSFAFASLLLSALSVSAQDATKLSPFTKIYLQQAAQSGAEPVAGYVYKVFNGERYISVLIKVTPGFADESLKPLGVRIGTKAGDIWTAQIPVQHVKAFTEVPGISYIQLDEPMHPTLDSARKNTRVDSVQGGVGLRSPFFGKGVVVGIIDAGFDYGSPALWDTGGKYYRVKRIWAQKTAGGNPPSGYIYGTEMNDSASMLAAGTDQTITSHGSHVTGIAAGSGYGTAGRYTGMAPLSDIVLVGIMPAQQQWLNTGGSDVIDGAAYIYRYADSVGKPAIINLSWGTSLGAHDGTSLYCQALDNLCQRGKIFATSAGNSGDMKLHIQKTFSAADSLLNTFVTYTSVQKTWVDIWGDAGKPFSTRITLYNKDTAGASTGVVTMDGLVHSYKLRGKNGDTCFVTITPVAAEYNGKPRSLITIYSRVLDSICLTVTASSGTVNMWNRYVEAPTGYESPFTNGGKSWAVEGDTLQTISDNACANSVITVAAYATKTSWRNAAGSGYSYPAAVRGAIADFSSVGPTQDGRMKPDIAGPGFGVVSTVSSYDPTFGSGSSNAVYVVSNITFPVTGRNQPYALLSGTSMSSPCVSGIIALLLEANPNLTPKQIQDLLNQTAIHDNFTGAAMDNTWGGGKVNAYGALKKLLQNTGVEGLQNNSLASHLYPNPAQELVTVGVLGDKAARLEVGIYDMAGRKVRSENWHAAAGYDKRDISIKELPKGLYIVRLQARDGSRSAMRLVVE